MVGRKPRVLIFSLAYLPLVGGAEIAVKEITDRLGVGVDFDLITLQFNKSHKVKEVMGNMNIYRIGGNKLTYPLRAALLAKKLQRQNDYKIVWSIMAAYAGWAALFFKFLHPKIPLLLTLQEGDSEKHILERVGILYPLWRMIFRKADYIQAISNYLAGFARRHGASCPVEIVPNGVNLDAYRSGKTYKSNRTYTIITTSRLVYKNGVDILIQAIAKLQVTSYKLQVLIVGDGPDRFKLEKLAADLNVADKVKFVGQIDPDSIPRYLAEADIFVRPSRSEGLGNSFLEAMAAGLPVIGTRVGGIPEFIKDGETGLFCRVDDPKDLAEKITAILGDAELYRRLSGNGRKLVSEKYSWSGIAKLMDDVFEKLKIENCKLKILIATGIYPPEVGGPATYAALLEKELPAHGIKVMVLPFRLVRNWPKGLRHFFYFAKAWRLCWKNDLVLAQDTISVGLPALLAAKLSGRKLIIRVPGDYVWEQSVQRFGVKDSIDDFQHPNSAPSPDGFGNTKAPIRIKRYPWQVEFLRSVQKFVVSHADLVITPSNYFRGLVRGWVKDKNKVVTIYNGIDLSATPKIRMHPNDTKEKLGSFGYNLGVSDRKKIMISAGRLVPWKGFGFLIELMQDLPEWKLIIVGDGPEREALKFQVSSFKLQDRVELIGSVPRERLFEYMRQAEIFVLNTHFESFSFQIVEAMSVGLPVVATNIGNLNEIIDNGVDGFLVEPDNRRQFLDVIERIDSDDNLRQKISRNAAIKSRNFSIENTINKLERVLTTL